MSETPNVVIENPKVRKDLGIALYVTGVLAGLAAYVLSGVPVPFDVDFVVAKVTGAIAIISGAFGLGVTLPNIPKAPVQDEADGYDPALGESEPKYAVDTDEEDMVESV